MPVRRFALVLCALAIAVLLCRNKISAAAADNPSGPTPVLAELFTSEGCSSCPPADDILAKLQALQPVAGARVIVLSEHVTYWDHLGWRDPFSDEIFTRRQQEYGNRFGLDDVYTPQMVIDGAQQTGGSNSRAIVKAIEAQLAVPKPPLRIQDAAWAEGTLHFSVDLSGASALKGDLYAALASDQEESSVERGENQGRHLQYVSVVRVLQLLKTKPGESYSIKLPKGLDRGKMHLVVFLQKSGPARVLAIATQPV